MKICSKCKIEKPFDQFSPDKKMKIGYKSNCKKCAREHVKKRYAESQEVRDRVKKYNKKYREENNEYYSEYQRTDKMKEYFARYREENKDLCLKRSEASRRKNRSKYNEIAYKRNRAVKMATPTWMDFIHKMTIETMYESAREITNRTGEQYTVDHIIPIQGKGISGLHVPWNLQILTMKENCRKGNSVDTRS